MYNKPLEEKTPEEIQDELGFTKLLLQFFRTHSNIDETRTTNNREQSIQDFICRICAPVSRYGWAWKDTQYNVDVVLFAIHHDNSGFKQKYPKLFNYYLKKCVKKDDDNHGDVCRYLLKLITTNAWEDVVIASLRSVDHKVERCGIDKNRDYTNTDKKTDDIADFIVDDRLYVDLEIDNKEIHKRCHVFRTRCNEKYSKLAKLEASSAVSMCITIAGDNQYFFTLDHKEPVPYLYRYYRSWNTFTKEIYLPDNIEFLPLTTDSINKVFSSMIYTCGNYIERFGGCINNNPNCRPETPTYERYLKADFYNRSKTEEHYLTEKPAFVGIGNRSTMSINEFLHHDMLTPIAL